MFYKNISDLIPFEIIDLIDQSRIVKINTAPNENFVHKQSFSTDILNQNFVNFLENKEILIGKVLIWHWYNKDPHWAHIDSDSHGNISHCALNWTLSTTYSQVNFYNISDKNKNVMFGNDADETALTENVTAYIPISVKGLQPDAIWNDRGPALINTGVPHLVVAPHMRVSVSLNFVDTTVSIDSILKKLESHVDV